MTTDKKIPLSNIVCACTGTREDKIIALIQQGADFEKISSATGAATGCGACDVDINNLIEQYKPREKL